MDEWKTASLSEIMEIVGGGTPKTSVAEYWNGDIPWLSVVDFNTGNKFVYTTEKSISKAGLDNSSTKYLNKGDLIISARGTVGALAVLTRPMTFNQSCYGLRGYPEITTNNYLYYLIKDTIEDIKSHTYGAVFDTITKDTFRNININLPPLPQQQAIAEVLSSLDDKIDLLHRNNKTLEQLAETLFRQWFVEDAEDGWENSDLGSCYFINRGLSYKGAGLCDGETTGAIKMMNLNSVYEGGGYKESGVKYYNGEYRERHLLYPGDLIITNTEQGHEHRLIGYCAIVPKSVGEKAIFSQHIYRVHPRNKRVTAIYLYHLLKTNPTREQVIGATNGSTVNMLHYDALERVTLRVPPEKLMAKFTKFGLEIQDKLEANNQQIGKLQILRDTLLPKLMSGAVRVNY